MYKSEEEIRAAAKSLMEGVTSADVHVLAIEALRRARRADPDRVELSMADLGLFLAPLLADRKKTPIPDRAEHQLMGPFLTEQAQPWMQPLADFSSWFARTGLGIPAYRSSAVGNQSGFRLTTAGFRFLDATGTHPLLPDFVRRVTAGLKHLPAEVADHLVDAQKCVDSGLGRPAVVLAGLAYEVAIDDVLDYLGNKIALKKGAKAADKIATVRKEISNLLGKPTNATEAERLGAAESAWDFADRLRARRNHGSHPGAHPDFDDLVAVHEWLVSAGRHLPGLWSVRV
jgi:hypothetical protein